jgi:dTDP-4-amino-4,6-dideoxygalactose transaminase
VTSDVSGRLLRLPFFNGLTDDELERVVESFLRATRSVTSGGVA